MSDSTPRLMLAELVDGQEMDAMTINDALIQLDAVTGLYLKGSAAVTPPTTPADGDMYLLGAAPTGAWTGRAYKLAYCLDGGWRFYTPFAGLCALAADQGRLIIFDGSAWVDYASVMAFQNLPLMGVNTTADTTNKLAVKSAALLFDNAGAGVQAKLNKHAGTDTASLLYQTGYSGRAEMGLCGDDSFHLKVSPDGSNWREALVVDKTTGYLGQGTSAPLAPLHVGWQSQSLAGTWPSSVTQAAMLAFSGDGTNQRFITLAVAGNTPNFQGVRFNGTLAAPTTILANQSVANFSSASYNGASFVSAANFLFLAEEDFSSSVCGTRFELQLTQPGTNSRATRLTVYGDGRHAATGARADQSYSLQTPTTGFSISVANACGQLILNPAGTLASGTITLPASPKDGQLCRIVSTAAVSALTLSAATGQTITGAVSTLAANAAVAFLYAAGSSCWYRVQ